MQNWSECGNIFVDLWTKDFIDVLQYPKIVDGISLIEKPVGEFCIFLRRRQTVAIDKKLLELQDTAF